LKSLQEQITAKLDSNNKHKKLTYTTALVNIIVLIMILIILIMKKSLYRKLSTFKNECEPGSAGSPKFTAYTVSTNTEAKPRACSKRDAKAKIPLPEII